MGVGAVGVGWRWAVVGVGTGGVGSRGVAAAAGAVLVGRRGAGVVVIAVVWLARSVRVLVVVVADWVAGDGGRSGSVGLVMGREFRLSQCCGVMLRGVGV